MRDDYERINNNIGSIKMKTPTFYEKNDSVSIYNRRGRLN